MVEGVVREWFEEEGWGVLDSARTPGGCFGHFSVVEMGGFRALRAGQRVLMEVEEPGFLQDGYAFRATKIVPRAS